MSHSVVHHTFTINRTYKASLERTFRAFQDPTIKRKWFIEGEGWTIEEHTDDFTVNGREFSRFRFGNSPEMTNRSIYQDIVPNARIVLAYTMTIGSNRISSSLATIEFKPAGTGTSLTYTEQGAYFDGLDQPKQREEGCNELYDKLGELLEAGLQ
jgi:uncharacterized protein YndB with AHSA1/START domain